MNSIVDFPRLEMLKEYLNLTKDVYGDIAEVGVYKGGSAKLLREFSDKRKKLMLFDTFEGMPEVNNVLDFHKKGDFSDTSISAVTSYLEPMHKTFIFKGLFPQETGSFIINSTFSLVHLDCDIFDSVFQSLNFLWPRVSLGGIVVLDDYLEPNCPGAKKAVDIFFDQRHDFKRLELVQSQIAFQAIKA